MGTKTIGLGEDTYERLKARKRADESFTDLVERLLEEATADWHEGFGTLDAAEMEELERAVERSREQASHGLVERQQEAFEALAGRDRDDETA